MEKLANPTFFRHFHLRWGLFLLLLLVGALGVRSAQAGPGVNWSYQRTITLSSATPSANFQIRVQLTDHSNMNADGSDLRFYDANDVQADYWIETWNMAGTSTVWVEVPTAGTTGLTMYYGNAGATAASNGNNTFIAFDDFSGGSIDSSKWDLYGSASIGSGSVALDGGDQLISKTPFAVSDGVIVETVLSSNVPFRGGSRASLNGASSLSGSGTFFTADEPINSQFAVWSHGRDNIYGIHLIQDGDLSDNGNTQYIQIWDSGGPNTWAANGYVLGTAFSTGRVEYFQNFTSMGVSTTNTPSGTLYPLLNNGLLSNIGFDPFSITTFRVRKFSVGYNPNVTVGNAITVVNSGANGGDGPGGVGVTDGTSTLELWLQANAATYTDTGCTTPAANGNAVACWADQSGNGYNISQGTAGARPQYQTGMLNSQPLLDFDGTSNYLRGGSTIPTPTNTLTILSVASTAQTGSFPQIVSHGTGGVDGWNLYWYSGGSYQGSFINLASGGSWGDNWALDSTSPTANQFYILSGWRNSGTTNVALNSTSTSDAGVANTINYGATPRLLVGAKDTASPGSFLDGGAAEVIYYSTDLTDIRRILVENYLSAKYGIDISASGNDHYDGDTAGNGDFDLNVAGIGQTGGNQHTQAHSAGMIVVNDTFLNENGDWLLFGHKTATNDNVITDLPSGGDWDGTNDLRWARYWYIDVTDASSNNGTVDIIFDFSEAGMGGPLSPPDGPASNYRLLKRAGATGQFSDITALSGATVVVIGDQVQFLGVDVAQLGSNFTLGSINALDSPTALTVSSFAAHPRVLQIASLILVGMMLSLLGIALWRAQQHA